MGGVAGTDDVREPAVFRLGVILNALIYRRLNMV